MSIVGAVCLWAFAIMGVFATVGLVWGAIDEARTKRELPPTPAPPVQITNLRTLPRPVAGPETDPNQPQILQKTTMQITTTKYVDPTPKELSA